MFYVQKIMLTPGLCSPACHPEQSGQQLLIKKSSLLEVTTREGGEKKHVVLM